MATAVPNPFDTQPPPQPSEPGSPQPGAQIPTLPPSPPPSPTAPPVGAAPPAIPSAAKVDPTMINMTSDQTVEGRSAGIIAKNSPLMQLAESRSQQAANSRGLINSSMAVGAGQTAVMDAATDIAKQDANTAAQTAQLNAAASNSAKTFNAGEANRFAMVDKTTQADLTKMGAAQTFDLAKMDRAAAQTLSQMSEQQKNDIAKMATQQGFNLQTMSAQQINDLAKMNVAQGFDLSKMDAQTANTIRTMGVQQQNDMAQLAQRQGYAMETLNAQQAADLVKMTKQIEANDEAAAKKYGYDSELYKLQAANNREVAGIEAQYKNLTQASASAASIINNVSSNVSKIMENTTLDAPAKQKAIDIYNANAQKALQMIGAISGDVDLVSFFDEVFTDPAVPA